MWPWFHCSWIIILPVAMIAVCILMRVFMRRPAFSGGRTCCSHTEYGSSSKSEKV